jgi:hypothetical protein
MREGINMDDSLFEKYKYCNIHIENRNPKEVAEYYNSAVGERDTNNLYIVIPFKDMDKPAYIFAINEFDAVYIYNKICGCLVPETRAELVNDNLLKQELSKRKNIISFEEQCELNDFSYLGENPEVEVEEY